MQWEAGKLNDASRCNGEWGRAMMSEKGHKKRRGIETG